MADAPRAVRPDLQMVLASRLIPEGAKLVWLQDWVLDPKGNGCWLTHAQLGERLGMSPRTVEKHRQQLAAAELHLRLPAGQTTMRGWRSIVPAVCRIRAPGMEPDAVLRRRVELDAWLGAWPPTPESVVDPPLARRYVRDPAEITPPQRVDNYGAARSASSAFDFDSESEATSSAVQASEANEVSPSGPKSKADERPARDVEAAGWEDIRRRHAERRAAVAAERERRGLA